MSIAKNAVNESKAVARLAVDAAKNELIEQLTPTIQAIIDGQLRRGALGEDVDRLRRAADGAGETEFEEGKEMKNKDRNESVAALFPGVNEVADMDMDEGEDYGAADEAVDEGGNVAAEGKGEDDVDETLELSEAELAAVYQEALQLEVDVKKGFSDMAKPHELGAGARAQYQSDPANLADMKSGEHQWEDETPPAKKKWTVEQLRPLIKRGMAENRALASQNAKLTEMVKSLTSKLSEMNLLNSKILHVNKFMAQHGRLTAEQKRSVIESIDRGASVKEVKNIYSILQNSLRAAGAISESSHRRPRADSQKSRTTGSTTPRSQVLRESAGNGGSTGDANFSRWKQLAGLVNG
jgi:hypothetical protein